MSGIGPSKHKLAYCLGLLLSALAGAHTLTACKGATDRFKAKDKSQSKEQAPLPAGVASATATNTEQQESSLPAWARNVDTSFWKKSEFVPPGTLTDISAAQVRSYFATTEDFYAKAPETKEQDELTTCFLDMLRKIPLKTSEHTVEVHATMDLMTCQLKESFLKQYQTQIDLIHVCENGNMAAWSGRSYGDLEKESQICGDGQALSIWRNNQHWIATGKTEKGVPFETVGSMLLGRADNDGEPCVTKIAQGRASDTACNQWSIYSLKISSIDGKPTDQMVESTYLRNVFDGVESLTDGSPWPEKGSVSVDYNIWEGKVSYRSAREAPTYEVKTPDGESVTGVVREPISLPPANALRLVDDIAQIGPLWSGWRGALRRP